MGARGGGGSRGGGGAVAKSTLDRRQVASELTKYQRILYTPRNADAMADALLNTENILDAAAKKTNTLGGKIAADIIARTNAYAQKTGKFAFSLQARPLISDKQAFAIASALTDGGTKTFKMRIW